jgi:dTDP-4-dehydrorhamnose 3,5-epimerase-like enzyme
MFKIFIRGGIAHGRTSLCATCASAHIVTGYRESEMVVICTEANPHIPIRFEVKECTEYSDRNRAEPVPATRKCGFFVQESTTNEEERKMVAVDK